MLPKVTVVTVTYNAADCVEMTLKSVIAQTYSNLEYIVVDGKSTDSTMDIVERYRAHISTIVSEPDKGIYDAMNKATRLASGEWIIFMNAGDVFDNPGVLRNVFTGEIKENSSLIFGAITEYSRPLGIKRVYQAHIISTDATSFPYREHIPCSHQATFYRTELLKQHPYRSEEFKVSADWASMADILDLNLPYTVVNDVIAWYQGGGDFLFIKFLVSARKRNHLRLHLSLERQSKNGSVSKIEKTHYSSVTPHDINSYQKKLFHQKSRVFRADKRGYRITSGLLKPCI